MARAGDASEACDGRAMAARNAFSRIGPRCSAQHRFGPCIGIGTRAAALRTGRWSSPPPPRGAARRGAQPAQSRARRPTGAPSASPPPSARSSSRRAAEGRPTAACAVGSSGVGVGVRRRGRAATQGHRVGPERSVGPRGDAIGSCLKGRRVWAETRCRGALFAQRGEGLPDAEHGAEGHDHVVGALRHLHPHLRLGVVADSPKKRRAQLGRRTRARE